MKPVYWIIVGVLAALAVAVAVFATLDTGAKPRTEDMGPAPDFIVKIIDGKKVSLKDFRGKPLVINFWASWCPPCREETPILVKVANRYRGRIRFLGIVFQDTVANVRTFEKEFDVPYENALDPTEAAAHAYKITGVPETFVIDSNGRLRASWIGAIDEKRLTGFVKSVLTE